MYPEEIVLPMKAQLTNNGFEDLTTPEKVLETLKKPGVAFVVINSVCGCSAGAARPAALYAAANATKKPAMLATAFAGFDIDAINILREHLAPFPPSSPAMAVFKDGELVHMLERHHIEGHSAEMIAENLMQAFEEYA